MAELFTVLGLDCNQLFISPTQPKDKNESCCIEMFFAVITVWGFQLCKGEGDCRDYLEDLVALEVLKNLSIRNLNKNHQAEASILCWI